MTTYAVISDGWVVEHHVATGVSYATKLLPNGRFDTSVPELVAEGDGHEHAIFDLIAEQIIADEDRIEPVEMRKAG